MPLHIIENGFIMLLIELILLIINEWRISVLYSTIMFKQMEFCSLISVMIWINPNFCFNFLLFLCADRRSWSCGIKYKASSQPVSLQVAYPLLILTLYLSSMDFNGLHFLEDFNINSSVSFKLLLFFNWNTKYLFLKRFGFCILNFFLD